MSRSDFLDHLRVARNLFEHGGGRPDAAIWLSPAAVKGFRADDFRDLGPDRQKALADAVAEFERVARQVPPDATPTGEQVAAGAVALQAILTILEVYFRRSRAESRVRDALPRSVFPPWVVNWDFKVGTDHADYPAVWVYLYADQKVVPSDQLGRYSIDVVPRLRTALQDADIDRWPYVSMRWAQEYKAG